MPHAFSQFPDDENSIHKLIVGLICCAVAIPFQSVLKVTFVKAATPRCCPELQLAYFMGFRMDWNWRKTRPGILRALSAQARNSEAKLRATKTQNLEPRIEPAPARKACWRTDLALRVR